MKKNIKENEIEKFNSNIGYLIYFKSHAEWYDLTVLPEIEEYLKQKGRYKSSPSGFSIDVDDIEGAMKAAREIKPFKTFQQAEKAAKILERIIKEENGDYIESVYYTIVESKIENVTILRIRNLEIE